MRFEGEKAIFSDRDQILVQGLSPEIDLGDAVGVMNTVSKIGAASRALFEQATLEGGFDLTEAAWAFSTGTDLYVMAGRLEVAAGLGERPLDYFDRQSGTPGKGL